MILVLLGSQKFQFNRLLVEIDNLINEGIIKEDVFAQIGGSDYTPKHYKYVKFLEKDEFSKQIDKSSLVITHAGTATIIQALKANKKVIAVARLKCFDEHVSDHQLDIIRQFSQLNFIIGVEDIRQLHNAIENVDRFEFESYQSSTNKIIELIDNYIIGLKV